MKVQIGKKYRITGSDVKVIVMNDEFYSGGIITSTYLDRNETPGYITVTDDEFGEFEFNGNAYKLFKEFGLYVPVWEYLIGEN